MRILITGAGRGGTCLLTEAVRGLNIVQFSKELEDRGFFKYKNLPANYGTKLTIEHPTFQISKLKHFMEKYQDLHIIFSLRHPLDLFLSKIRRGQKASDGGDKKNEIISSDGTPSTALAAIKDFYLKYKIISTHQPERVFAVKLEDLLISPKKTITSLAKNLDAKPVEKAFKFYRFNRNRYQKKRYGNVLDLSQIELYRRWDTVYDGFFKNRKKEIEYAKNKLNCIIISLGYEVNIK